MTRFAIAPTDPTHVASLSTWEGERLQLLERIVRDESLAELLPAMARAVQSRFSALGSVLSLASPEPDCAAAQAECAAPLESTGRPAADATYTVPVHALGPSPRTGDSTATPIGSVTLVGITRDDATPEHTAVLQDVAHLCALVHARDTSARRGMHDALRDQQAMFAGIVESAMDAIISVDHTGRIVVFNATAERIFQVPAADAIGGTLERFLPESERGRHAGHMQQFAHTGVTTRSMGRQSALRAVRADGTVFPIEATISRTQVDGHPLLTVILRDVSAREQLEQQLRQGQKMEAMGHLAGGVAHDFNNLLTVILSGVDQARFDLPEGDPVREELDQVLDAARRAAGLTRQLLAFSRKQVLQLQPLDLNDVLRSIERLLRRVIGEDIALAVECPAELTCVHADIGQLEQVLVNLSVNARDAMPYGGSLQLRVQNVLRRDLPLALQPHHSPQAAPLPEELVLLTVRDSGLGMDEATLARVFEPFFTTKETGRGTGLGLSTVYGIVEQSGGAIAIESQRERGTTVLIALPRHRGASSDHHPPLADVPRERSSGTVLVVEDDDGVRSIVSRSLTQAGYVVIEARNSPDGRHRWDEARSAGIMVDLVVTDMVMPGGSGRELVDSLRGDRADLPALFMSGYADDRLRVDQDPEITGFLAKPFTTPQLLLEARRLLRVPRH